MLVPQKEVPISVVVVLMGSMSRTIVGDQGLSYWPPINSENLRNVSSEKEHFVLVKILAD